MRKLIGITFAGLGFAMATVAAFDLGKVVQSAEPAYIEARQFPGDRYAYVLVGLGCDGGHTYLAAEEDHFPGRCDTIEPLTLDRD